MRFFATSKAGKTKAPVIVEPPTQAEIDAVDMVDAYSSVADFQEARLMYDLMTMPIRGPRKQIRDAPLSLNEDPLEARLEAFDAELALLPADRADSHRQQLQTTVELRKRAVRVLQGCNTVAQAANLVLKRLPSRNNGSVLLDRAVADAVIGVYGREGKIGLEVLQEWEESGRSADCVMYTSLIRNASMVGDWEEAWRLFRRMRYRDDGEPDEVMMTVMIRLCATRQETEKAMGFYEEMLQLGLQPTEVTYDALLSACAVRRDYADEAVVLFGRAQGAGHVPTESMFDSVLMALAQKRDNVAAIDVQFEHAQEVLREQEGMTSRLRARLVMCYAKQCEIGSGTGGLDVEQLVARGATMLAADKDDPMMQDAYLRLLCGAMRLRRAEEYMRTLPATPTRWDWILRMLWRARRAEWAVKLGTEALKSGQLTAAGASYVLGACARAYYLRTGKEFLTKAENAGLRLDAGKSRAYRQFLHLDSKVKQREA